MYAAWVRRCHGCVQEPRHDEGQDDASSASFTLTEVECMGTCTNVPMVQINDDNYEDLDYDSMSVLLEALANDKPVKIGPQIERQTSCPEGGPTTLKEMVKANTDYRKEWT